MQNHVPTKETCQKLAEHVELDTNFYWITEKVGRIEEEPPIIACSHKSATYDWSDWPGYRSYEKVPAPLLSETVRKLPEKIGEDDHLRILKQDGLYFVGYGGEYGKMSNNPAESAAQCLIQLVQDNEVNHDNT